ncbi:hypothetical protein BJ508DRAFT_85311 [Ascobolus immersus RN42]|uniref:Uncharacterized protein n=1 Tax=Ascobolus immersus RN42 TaxID=1160509 RepID=A0A3N4HII6_ASCIM|nr:hypothetical protein BJ508DRAFT_85311 [Ascobolus immersus RN42]
MRGARVETILELISKVERTPVSSTGDSSPPNATFNSLEARIATQIKSTIQEWRAQFTSGTLLFGDYVKLAIELLSCRGSITEEAYATGGHPVSTTRSGPRGGHGRLQDLEDFQSRVACL